MSKSSEEKDCLIIFWKIKNFSYCWRNNKSPEFTWDGKQCWLDLDPKYLTCKVSCSNPLKESDFKGEISFLTCDGLRGESSYPDSGYRYLSVSSSKDIIFGERRNAFLPKDTLTIRCRLNKGDRQPSGGKVYIYSSIGVKRSCFLWTLNNASLQYTVKEFSVENSDLYGCIQLNLKFSGGINSDEQIYIEVSRSGGESCYSVLKISVLDHDGKAVNFVSDEFVFEKEDRQQVWRFPPFIRKKTLENRRQLSLKCDFVITLGKVTDQTAVYSYFGDIIPLLEDFEDPSKCLKGGSVSKSITDLETDLKTILDNEILCDVDLQIGSEVIQAHRNILSARSPVFKAMFTKDMKETISETIVIEDLKVETVKRMLIYMYTDGIHDYQWENILNLYIAANKYEILGLISKCSSFLKENLSFSNVCEVLVLADLHQDQGLLSSVHEFISKYNSEVFASEPWKELEKNNSSLALKTLRELSQRND